LFICYVAVITETVIWDIRCSGRAVSWCHVVSLADNVMSIAGIGPKRYAQAGNPRNQGKRAKRTKSFFYLEYPRIERGSDQITLNCFNYANDQS
jgi:hypothetical protein